MGLSLQVGVARHVFDKSVVSDLLAALQRDVSYRMPFTFRPLPWAHRDEMASSWIGELQALAEQHGRFPQLAACDGWSTVYLPIVREPSAIEYGHHDGRVRVSGRAPFVKEIARVLEAANAAANPGTYSLICGSLPLLATELRALGASARLPVDTAGCEALVREDTPARQCFGHFVLAVMVAERRRHPLWVVK